MKGVRVGILKCIDSIRWAIPSLIDRVLPYQFLVNQLADCSTKDGQFQCPTCRDAIQERLSDGRVTVHGVVHRIAKHEASRNWKVTYPEMYKAVKQDLLTSINRQVAICARNNGLEGRYHMVLRKGKELGLKLANKVATVILPAALVVGCISYVVYSFNESNRLEAIYEVGTKDISTTGMYYKDGDGGKMEGSKPEPMCIKCGYTVGMYYNPANGHELITASNGELVRSCPLD
tara:strand:+ start:1266 stop:1964 length:699 start_codon:yes stop_codon:yes gene_type:complete